MFKGFSREAIDFLFGIRLNNSKEWFEPRKKIYTKEIYEPLKELTEAIYKPFENSGMIFKTGRIYRDESFPPYLHYRDTLWIYVRYQAYYWNKTPTLYFELSPEGAEFGFRIAKPEAAVMESFRQDIANEPQKFLSMADVLKKQGIEFGGEEYKRKKKCSVSEAEEFFIKKGLSAYRRISDIPQLDRPELAEEIIETFRLLMPLNDYFHDIVEKVEIEKALSKAAEAVQSEEPVRETVKAPDVEFMW